uniref:Uncharacterized protein n=1 Tax=Arundo donax TaxID=35708 RepID=A0A0A9C537_ARUDO
MDEGPAGAARRARVKELAEKVHDGGRRAIGRRLEGHGLTRRRARTEEEGGGGHGGSWRGGGRGQEQGEEDGRRRWHGRPSGIRGRMKQP